MCEKLFTSFHCKNGDFSVKSNRFSHFQHSYYSYYLFFKNIKEQK
jgi:hypothetical protein